MEFFRDTQINFMKYRKFWVVVSLAMILLSVFAIFIHGRLNVGIDFSGGTQLTLKFKQEPDIDELRDLLAAAGLEDAQIQRFGEEAANEVMIKTPLVGDSDEGSRDEVVTALDTELNPEGLTGFDLNQVGADGVADYLFQEDPEGLLGEDADDFDAADARQHYQELADSILDLRREEGLISAWEELESAPAIPAEVVASLREGAHLSSFAVLGVENVGPTIGRELRNRGVAAVVLSLLGMLAYIWIRFELRFGIGALAAVVHDVFVCLGLYALADFEFNLTTIAAFLTLVGYSVNDTVVVFDRVRENMNRHRRKPLVELMDLSVNQTLSRTVLTSGTTLLAVGTLLMYGGDVLRGFAFVLSIGIVVGTYSSIYIASPFALLWDNLFGSEAKSRRAAKAA